MSGFRAREKGIEGEAERKARENEGKRKMEGVWSLARERDFESKKIARPRQLLGCDVRRESLIR